MYDALVNQAPASVSAWNTPGYYLDTPSFVEGPTHGFSIEWPMPVPTPLHAFSVMPKQSAYSV